MKCLMPLSIPAVPRLDRRSVLSLTPRFSGVTTRWEGIKPFQRFGAIFSLTCLLLFLLLPQGRASSPLVVCNGDLEEALNTNGNTNAVVVLSCINGTNLLTHTINITNNVTLSGGTHNATISAGNGLRLFNVNPGV